MNLVGNQQSLPAQGTRQLSRLTARCGTQVKHPLAGTRRAQCRRDHGACLLNIVQPRLMVRVSAGTQGGVIGIVPAVRREGYALRKEGEQCPHAVRDAVQPERIDAQGGAARLVVGRKERRVFRPQQAAHPVGKAERECAGLRLTHAFASSFSIT